MLGKSGIKEMMIENEKEFKICPVCKGRDLSILGMKCRRCNGTGKVENFLYKYNKMKNKRDKELQDKNKLKPCPFCGKDKATLSYDYSNLYRFVFCKECGVRTLMYHNDEDAIAVWNRRDEDDKHNS